MKRLFIATKITLSPEYHNLMAQLKQELRHDDITWVKDEVSHLTLRFLGATPDSKIPGIKEALCNMCEQSTPFYLDLDKLGVFGSRYKPEVLWLGFSEFFFYKQLFDRLEPQLLEQGFEPAYGNFVPHITLGRVKNVINKQRFWKTIDALTPQCSQMIPITEMTLFQSFLHKDGPEYKTLVSYPLKMNTDVDTP